MLCYINIMLPSRSIVAVLVVTILMHCGRVQLDNAPQKFPGGFMFGVGTSSYQVEGAWNEDGKAESIWDHLTHMKPCSIKDCSTADVAANSYHLYKRDVEMMRELGVDFYRFSISWPRLLPSGFPDHVNPVAVEFYNNYINEMIKYNITPMITLFHWDLPQRIQEHGGWTSPRIFDWFSDYARTAFRLFGDRVKFWITINEPDFLCFFTYKKILFDKLGAYENINKNTFYNCSKIILMAHAKVWHLYDKEFRPLQGGNISIALSSIWYEPENEKSLDDVEAANDAHYANFGYYADPIFSKGGNFSNERTLARKTSARTSARGYALARLPQLSDKEKEYIRGTSDYFSLNHYSSKYVYRNVTTRAQNEINDVQDWEDIDVRLYSLKQWQIGESNFIKYTPWGFHKMLTKIRTDYDNPPVYILENGFSTTMGLQDDDRVTYHRGYLSAMLDAIDEGSDVRGYAVWSLMDSFEWLLGYHMTVASKHTARLMGCGFRNLMDARNSRKR